MLSYFSLKLKSSVLYIYRILKISNSMSHIASRKLCHFNLTLSYHKRWGLGHHKPPSVSGVSPSGILLSGPHPLLSWTGGSLLSPAGERTRFNEPPSLLGELSRSRCRLPSSPHRHCAGGVSFLCPLGDSIPAGYPAPSWGDGGLFTPLGIPASGLDPI